MLALGLRTPRLDSHFFERCVNINLGQIPPLLGRVDSQKRGVADPHLPHRQEDVTDNTTVQEVSTEQRHEQILCHECRAMHLPHVYGLVFGWQLIGDVNKCLSMCCMQAHLHRPCDTSSIEASAIIPDYRP